MPIVRRISTSLVATFLLAIARPVWADLDGSVRTLLGDDNLKGATVAVSIRDCTSGVELVEIRDEIAMIPASNMKLITTGAMLDLFGAEFDYRTRMILDDGRLVVIGDGDPAFGDPELLQLLQLGESQGVTVEQFLSIWVDAVVASGVTQVDEVIVDDRIFDRTLIHESWPKDQLNRRYAAEVSGLIFHTNVLHFFPRVVRGAAPDVTKFVPYAPWLDLGSNRATSDPNSGNTFGIARSFEENNFTFLGNVQTDYRAPAPVTVHDMPGFFARLLADRLEQAGIDVGGWRVADVDDASFDGRAVAPIVRTPISTVVTRCNRDSQNLYAEAMLKRIGWKMTSGTQQGSWENGAAAIRMIVADRIDNRSVTLPLRIHDGSGLSRKNRVSAELLTSWLQSFHDDPELGPVFIGSLAVGGESGTLDDRFRSWPFSDMTVQAKSGYINGVSCLSGYVTAENGRRYAFSILMNDVRPGTVWAAKAVQERIVKAIAEAMRPQTAEAVEIGG